jgi:hypothetical protein
MRNRKILPVRNFQHKTFAILAVFAIVAFLMTLKPVAEVVKKGLDMVGLSTAVELIQITASYMMMFAVGAMLLLITPLILVASIKIIVTLVAVAVIGWSIYSIYQAFTKKPVTNPLPQGFTNILK